MSTCEIKKSEEKIITFYNGIPGLEETKEFVFLTPPDLYPFYILQSVNRPDCLLPVVNPFDIYKEYELPISEGDMEALCTQNKKDLLILNVAVISKDITKMTVNMAAPIVINTKELVGKQVIPDNSNYSIREPLYETYLKLKKKGGQSHACTV